VRRGEVAERSYSRERGNYEMSEEFIGQKRPLGIFRSFKRIDKRNVS